MRFVFINIVGQDQAGGISFLEKKHDAEALFIDTSASILTIQWQNMQKPWKSVSRAPWNKKRVVGFHSWRVILKRGSGWICIDMSHVLCNTRWFNMQQIEPMLIIDYQTYIENKYRWSRSVYLPSIRFFEINTIHEKRKTVLINLKSKH